MRAKPHGSLARRGNQMEPPAVNEFRIVVLHVREVISTAGFAGFVTCGTVHLLREVTGTRERRRAA